MTAKNDELPTMGVEHLCHVEPWGSKPKEDELKSCPFCGDTNSLRVGIASTEEWHCASVCCDKCEGEGPYVEDQSSAEESADKAIELWNRRAK